MSLSSRSPRGCLLSQGCKDRIQSPLSQSSQPTLTKWSYRNRELMITEISVDMMGQKAACHGVACKGIVRNFGKEEFCYPYMIREGSVGEVAS